jgi:hypothetical protein
MFFSENRLPRFGAILREKPDFIDYWFSGGLAIVNEAGVRTLHAPV